MSYKKVPSNKNPKPDLKQQGKTRGLVFGCKQDEDSFDKVLNTYTEGLFPQVSKVNKFSPVADYDTPIDFDAITKYWDGIERKITPFFATFCCKTRGVVKIDLTEFDACSDKECEICFSWSNAIDSLINNK